MHSNHIQTDLPMLTAEEILLHDLFNLSARRPFLGSTGVSGHVETYCAAQSAPSAWPVRDRCSWQMNVGKTGCKMPGPFRCPARGNHPLNILLPASYCFPIGGDLLYLLV